jgi:glycosyltransferase involved in cell wall biosynthesis
MMSKRTRSSDNPLRVHVHLAHGFGRATWAAKFDGGRLVGINERDPYGYLKAEGMGAAVQSSVDHSEGLLGKVTRLGLRVILGFDGLHVWRNRREMMKSDVIWTHTESQFLGVALMFKLTGAKKKTRPKLIGQSVWMIDSWKSQPFWRRHIWRSLVAETDVLTFLSPVNQGIAKDLFPGKKSEMVPFGIRADRKIAPRQTSSTEGLNLISVGNDRDRDWATAIEAMRAFPNDTLTIVSKTCDPRLLVGCANVILKPISSNDELESLYQKADIAIVPLKDNLHASGITVLEEASLFGLPSIVSRAGGIDAYFPEDMVSYVDVGKAADLVAAIARMKADPSLRYAMAQKSQDHMGPDGLSSESYVRHHVRLSRNLLDHDEADTPNVTPAHA